MGMKLTNMYSLKSDRYIYHIVIVIRFKNMNRIFINSIFDKIELIKIKIFTFKKKILKIETFLKVLLGRIF